MTQDKKFLGTEPVGRLLWRLAVPTVIAQLVNMLYNIVDRIYIGCGRLPAADTHCVRLCGAGGLRRRAPGVHRHGPGRL